MLALVLAGAAALRLVAVERDAEAGEREVVGRAWGIVHGNGVDPHPFFEQPSLFLYAVAPFESWQDAPSILSARVVVVVVALLGIAAAWWLGDRAYDVVAGGVGAVATGVAGVHVAYSRTAVEDVLLATLLTVALALLVTGKLELAGVAIGLAAAAKWPGVLALVPLVVVAWGQWRRLAIAGGAVLAAFVLASPFVLLHPGETAGDVWDGFSEVRSGEDGVLTPFSNLWEALGPALVVALLGLAVAAAVRAPADRVLLAFVGVYLVALLPLGSNPDRYVLPLVPALGVLAGRFRSFAPVTLLLLIVPLTWTVRETRELAGSGEPAAEARVLQLPSGR